VFNAVPANPYVVPYLLDPDSLPFDRPPHFALRSREKAAYVAESLADAFTATNGALAWLSGAGTAFSPRPRMRGDADRSGVTRSRVLQQGCFRRRSRPTVRIDVAMVFT
jgi:hypothetical protein